MTKREPNTLRTWDVTTNDGEVHLGFRAWSAASAGYDFLREHPCYWDEDVVSIVPRPTPATI